LDSIHEVNGRLVLQRVGGYFSAKESCESAVVMRNALAKWDTAQKRGDFIGWGDATFNLAACRSFGNRPTVSTDMQRDRRAIGKKEKVILNGASVRDSAAGRCAVKNPVA
jgi:hypothetical protein